MPQSQDYNQDHRATAQAVITATRPAPSQFKPFQKTILVYESIAVANWGHSKSDNPNFYIELSEEELHTKLKALGMYRSQIRPGSHPRSIASVRNHARYQGMQIGVSAAEAYFCYRNVI